MMLSSTDYREKAATLRARAKAMTLEVVRKQLYRIAYQYEALATEKELLDAFFARRRRNGGGRVDVRRFNAQALSIVGFGLWALTAER